MPKSSFVNFQWFSLEIMTTSLKRLGWKEDPAPAKPNRNVLSRYRALALLSGYIRNNNHCSIPNDIIDLCSIWITTKGVITGYEHALDILLNKECCIGIYDFKMRKWRRAYYIRHYEQTRKIMVRYSTLLIPDEILRKHTDKFCIIEQFPVNFVTADLKRFYVTYSDLKENGGLNKQQLENWKKRIQDNYAHDQRLLDRILDS